MMNASSALDATSGRVAGSSFGAGLWRLADPKISLASLASLFLSTAWGAAHGSLHWGWLLVTVLGILAVEIAKNASGEIVDFDSGADQGVAAEDRSPFSGGKRVLVDGLLTPYQTAAIAAVAYFLCVVAGLSIVVFHEARVLWLGIIGIGLAYEYHAAPLRLSYHGFGEIAVAFCYGPLIGIGNAMVQGAPLTPGFVAVMAVLGLLIGAFLWINEFPDYASDRAAGKQTLVVRLGRRRAAQVFAGIMVAALAAAIVLPFLGVPAGVWLGLAAAVPGFSAVRTLLREPERTHAVVPAQVRTLQTFVLFAVAGGIGLRLFGS